MEDLGFRERRGGGRDLAVAEEEQELEFEFFVGVEGERERETREEHFVARFMELR